MRKVVSDIIGRSNPSVDDLVMDAFIKGETKFHLYDPTKGALSTWMCAIARNEAYHYLEKKRVYVRMPESYDAPSLEPQPFASEETEMELKRCMEYLDTMKKREHAQAYLLHYVDNVPYQKIADQFGWTIGKVKTIFHRINEKMRAKGYRKDKRKKKKQEKVWNKVLQERFIHRRYLGEKYYVYVTSREGKKINAKYLGSYLNIEEARVARDTYMEKHNIR